MHDQLGVLFDPVCDVPSKHPPVAAAHAVAGGAWTTPAIATAAAIVNPSVSFEEARQHGPAGGLDAYALTGTGFRCAYPAL